MVAQTEMENIYHASETSDVNIISWFDSAYSFKEEENDWRIYTKTSDAYVVHIKVNEASEEDELHRVVVQVFEENDTANVKTQMENHFTWERTTEHAASK